MKIGIIREEKIPTDTRVAFTPNQIKSILNQYPSFEFYVQPSSSRCFPDEDFLKAGAKLTEHLSLCDYLFGVKEVPIQSLIPEKPYFFFSHTIKKQAYNKKLLKAVLEKNIQLIDYECITNENNIRLVAFGRWAGIVGSYNGLRLWNKRVNSISNATFTELQSASQQKDYDSMVSYIKSSQLAPCKIAVSGDGRVARGAWELLDAAGVKEVSAEEFVSIQNPNKPIYVKLTTEMLYKHKINKNITLSHFFKHPDEYDCTFKEFFPHTDLFINAVFWDPKAPLFFTWEEMQQENFAIKAIADITCDIEGSVPCTLKATTIANPFMGIDKLSKSEIQPFSANSIDMMTVDNLPNELPRNASEEFGNALSTFIIPDLMSSHEITERATIAKNGEITPKFSYLKDWVNN
jgi:saccharopine dehydrogenase (NAD+, L-lysine forming)